jgi:hypothetical protein
MFFNLAIIFITGILLSKFKTQQQKFTLIHKFHILTYIVKLIVNNPRTNKCTNLCMVFTIVLKFYGLRLFWLCFVLHNVHNFILFMS